MTSGSIGSSTVCTAQDSGGTTSTTASGFSIVVSLMIPLPLLSGDMFTVNATHYSIISEHFNGPELYDFVKFGLSL